MPTPSHSGLNSARGCTHRRVHAASVRYQATFASGVTGRFWPSFAVRCNLFHQAVFKREAAQKFKRCVGHNETVVLTYSEVTVTPLAVNPQEMKVGKRMAWISLHELV